MEVIVSARHFELGDELRTYAEAKVTELAQEHPKLTTARVVLELQRNWQMAEIHLNGKHLDLIASAKTDDMYASIDATAEKLERQLRKHLDKIQEHRAKESIRTAEAEETAGDEESQVAEKA
ncbi:MAG: ribosome-associated translation inhibitor RaiA [Lentisphaeria bacterium]|jgi:putative sigma-54 modulation protein|nr:ribosome-associated translation inhibitor RaiA [Lentisphaeria bacterium]